MNGVSEPLERIRVVLEAGLPLCLHSFLGLLRWNIRARVPVPSRKPIGFVITSSGRLFCAMESVGCRRRMLTT